MCIHGHCPEDLFTKLWQFPMILHSDCGIWMLFKGKEHCGIIEAHHKFLPSFAFAKNIDVKKYFICFVGMKKIFFCPATEQCGIIKAGQKHFSKF